MTFTREGYTLMALAGTASAAVFATSAWRRSWSLWLLGFALLVGTIVVAWVHRDPVVPSHTTAALALAVAVAHA